MKIFLIAGKAESGKGELAKIIKEYYIYQRETSVITEYGKYIKSLATEILDWDGNNLTKPRKELQELGAKVRDFNPKYFTNNMLQDIALYETLTQNVIISDVRMPEEIDEIKNVYDNVYAIYIENQFKPSTLSIEEQIDITETALENYCDYDYTIVNDTLENVKRKMFDILGELK